MYIIGWVKMDHFGEWDGDQGSCREARVNTIQGCFGLGMLREHGTEGLHLLGRQMVVQSGVTPVCIS